MQEANYRVPAGPAPLERYVSSGRVPFLGLVLGLGAGSGAALVLAFVYAWAVVYCPVVQLSVLLTLVFGALVGAATTKTMQALHVRSRLVVVGASLMLAFGAWLVSWVPWVYLTLSHLDVPFANTDAVNPFFFLDALLSIYENGAWSIGTGSSTPVRGAFLGAVWLGEGALIVGLAGVAAFNLSKDRVFCEGCSSWCPVVWTNRRYALSAAADLGPRVQSGDLSALEQAPLFSGGSSWIGLRIASCPGCGNTHVVGLDAVTESFDRRGNRSVSTRALLPFHLISRDSMAELRRRLGV